MTVRFYLKRPEAKMDTVIFARISYGAIEPLRYYIPEAITPKYWNKNTQRAKQQTTFPEYPEFNARLDKIEAGIKDVIRTYINSNGGELPDRATLKTLLDARFSKNTNKEDNTVFVVPFFERIIQQSKDGVRMNPITGKPIAANTIRTYGTYKGRLLDYEKHTGKRLRFDDVNQRFYDDFTAYLTTVMKLSINTIGRQVRNIKQIMNQALHNELTTNTRHQSRAFAAISEEADTVFLNEDELKALAALNLAHVERLDNVRDLFLIGCYTGLRYSDLSRLQPSAIVKGIYHTKAKKTGDKIAVPIRKEVFAILAKRNGNPPPAISNNKMNEYIREAAGMVDILKAPHKRERTTAGVNTVEEMPKYKLISTHTARRSFATNEYLKQTPILSIMAITGHKTEKAFMKYIRLTADQHAVNIQKSWDKKVSK